MKKVLLLVMITLLIFLGCGCMRNESGSNELTNNSKSAEKYLSNKYNEEFVFVSYGDDVWSSKSKSSIYSNKNGQNFTVKENSGYFTDNYCSVLFDTTVSEHVNGLFDDNVKVFINTQSAFLFDTKQFDTASNYLKECAVINVAIYTTQIEHYEEIAKQLLVIMNDCTVSAVVYCVDVEDFATITEYKSTAKVLTSGSFWIENNEISSKSWEE